MDKNTIAKQKFVLFRICCLIILSFVGLGVACNLKEVEGDSGRMGAPAQFRR
jgi:hypothetical protein